MMFALFARLLVLAASIHAGLIALVGAVVAGQDHPQLMYEGWVGDNAEIFVFDVHRNIGRNLTKHLADDIHPVWSPDGQHIAFESLRDGVRWVYIMDANGGNLRRLTTQTEFGEADPAWSDDGTQVILRGLRRRRVNPIYSVDVRTGVMTQLDLTVVPRRVDTERVVFMAFRDGQWGIYVTDPTRTRTYPLLRNNMGFSETPHWSPNESLVAFLAQTRATSQVYVMNADGSAFRQATFDQTLKIGLSWRP